MVDATLISKIEQAVDEIESEQAEELVKQAIAEGLEPLQIINEAIVPGLQGVGEKFNKGEYFLAELTMAGQLSKELIDMLTPLLPKGEGSARKKVLMGSVAGDMHDTGKNLVGLMLSCSGYEVIDMGKNVPTYEFVNKIKEIKPDVVGLSSLMVTTLPNQAEVIQYLKETGLRDQLKVIVGGGPTTQEFADSIGADGWAPDAAKAVTEVDRLLGIRR